VTPEKRAQLVVKALHAEHGVGAGGELPAGLSVKLREQIADAILNAMMECREVCTYIPDKDRIAQLVNGTLERSDV
jgi:hypothetical protein